MSLSYEAALSTLQSMFADQGYTSAHFDAVLRHQGGHMENTVETLLLHGDGSPEELIRKLPTLTPGVPMRIMLRIIITKAKLIKMRN